MQVVARCYKKTCRDVDVGQWPGRTERLTMRRSVWNLWKPSITMRSGKNGRMHSIFGSVSSQRTASPRPFYPHIRQKMEPKHMEGTRRVLILIHCSSCTATRSSAILHFRFFRIRRWWSSSDLFASDFVRHVSPFLSATLKLFSYLSIITRVQPFCLHNDQSEVKICCEDRRQPHKCAASRFSATSKPLLALPPSQASGSVKQRYRDRLKDQVSPVSLPGATGTGRLESFSLRWVGQRWLNVYWMFKYYS